MQVYQNYINVSVNSSQTDWGFASELFSYSLSHNMNFLIYSKSSQVRKCIRNHPTAARRTEVHKSRLCLCHSPSSLHSSHVLFPAWESVLTPALYPRAAISLDPLSRESKYGKIGSRRRKKTIWCPLWSATQAAGQLTSSWRPVKQSKLVQTSKAPRTDKGDMLTLKKSYIAAVTVKTQHPFRWKTDHVEISPCLVPVTLYS